MEGIKLKKHIVFFVFFVLVLANGCDGDSAKTMKSRRISFPEIDLEMQVEIAESVDHRAQGLMYRTSMGLNKGMLFVFEQQGEQRVWMKNTLLALDIIFLSNERKVVSILHDIKPCKQKECAVYGSKKTAKYMLEVNAGVAKRAGLKVGQVFVLGNK